VLLVIAPEDANSESIVGVGWHQTRRISRQGAVILKGSGFKCFLFVWKKAGIVLSI
jgi:hypothetical protein